MDSLKARLDHLRDILSDALCCSPEPTRAPVAAEGGERENDEHSEAKEIPKIDRPLTAVQLQQRLQKSIVLVVADHGSGSGFFVSPDMVLTTHQAIDTAGSDNVVIVGASLPVPQNARIVREALNRSPRQDYVLLKLDHMEVEDYLPMSRNLRVAQPVTSAIFQPLPNDNEASLQALRGGYSTTLPLLSIKQGNVVTASNHNDQAAVIIHTAVGGGVLMDACGRIVGMAAVTVPPPSKGTEAALAASDLIGYLHSNGVPVAHRDIPCVE